MGKWREEHCQISCSKKGEQTAASAWQRQQSPGLQLGCKRKVTGPSEHLPAAKTASRSFLGQQVSCTWPRGTQSLTCRGEISCCSVMLDWARRARHRGAKAAPTSCMGAFNRRLQRCHNKLSYSVSVLSAQCLLMSGTGKSKQALQLSSTQGWRAVSLEGAVPAQRRANAQSMQRCSYNVCRSLSAQARAQGSALLDPLMHPWDHHPSQYHPSTHGHWLLFRGLCQLGASARPRLELGFSPGLCAVSAEDGADVSSHHPCSGQER